MTKNIMNCTTGEFVTGAQLRATVKNVCKTGIMVKMPRNQGSGVISPRCWGDVSTRNKAISAIRPEDQFEVIVRSFDPKTMTLSLILDNHLSLLPKKSEYKVLTASKKSKAKTLEPGTVLLWDVANLFGKLGVEHAAFVLDSISTSLSKQGYSNHFFIEKRCLIWALHNQPSRQDVTELKNFSLRGDVTIVGEDGNRKSEADGVILKMAEKIPNSICITQDQYKDYADIYPNIVGTNRIRGFSIAKVGGKTIVIVNGVQHAVDIDFTNLKAEVSPGEAAVLVAQLAAPDIKDSDDIIFSDLQPSRIPREVVYRDSRGGLLAIADSCALRGDARNAERIYTRMAKREPDAYLSLAEMYRDGKGVDANKKTALRYERLARKGEKRRKERRLRDERRLAELMRSGVPHIGHCSMKRRQAVNMALVQSKREMVSEYFKFKHQGKVRSQSYIA